MKWWRLSGRVVFTECTLSASCRQNLIKLSASLRWTCSSESWSSTNSCLETASPTSPKSSERGKLTFHGTQETSTHIKTTLITHPSTQFVQGADYRFVTLDSFHPLRQIDHVCGALHVLLWLQTHTQRHTHTSWRTCSSNKTQSKKNTIQFRENEKPPVRLLCERLARRRRFQRRSSSITNE